MKICFVAPANNYHTKKWCKWFVEQGHEVHVISFIDDKIENAEVHYIDTGASASADDSQKLRYLLKAKDIKKTVNIIKPDIINVHYATSYGTAVALSGIKGYVLSVWGADIYDFPKKSFLHKCMLKYSLSKAEHIFSTSAAMAKETNKYTKKAIEVTPFGVDMNLFNPNKRNRSDENEEFIVGTVKALTPKYGIDYLLRAVAIIKKQHNDIPIKIRIAGKGAYEEEYKKLGKDLGIDELITWLGFIPQSQAAQEWANMDLAVIASTLESESFGVSAVEAEACETAVIISDIPGLMEATLPDQTSCVVRRKEPNELADTIINLYYDSDKRLAYGKNGRKYVENKFEINNCFKHIEALFQEYIK